MQNVRLRSANRGNGNNAWIVNSDGNVNNNNAHNTFRCAPDCGNHQGEKDPVIDRNPPDETQGAVLPASMEEANNRLWMRDGRVPDLLETTYSLYFDPCCFEALYESMERCQKGVTWKGSVAHYVLNGIDENLKLERDLKHGTYHERPVCEFIVTRPMLRHILSIAFRDRIYQRSLNDNVLYPTMTHSFIRENCACQKFKGTDFARGILEGMMRSSWRKHGSDCWVLQCDIKGYYPNMNHEFVEDLFKVKLSPEIYQRVLSILHNQYHGDVGYNPGSQMIQIAGISVLDGMDHYIKEWLGIRNYLRYMDDFILIADDPVTLECCKEAIAGKLAKIGFKFNEKKTRIYPISKGIKFLGFVFHIDSNGHVYRILNPENPKKERKHLASMIRSGKMEDEKIYFCYGGWRTHSKKTNSHKLTVRMDEYYHNLTWRKYNVG